MKTTLKQIRDCSPCSEGWSNLLTHLGKTKADDEELQIRVILESNGLDDALWCLKAVDGFDREKRLFSVWCVKQVKHLMTDPRSLNALEVAQRFAEDDASQDDLNAAWDAAWAARAAWDAAWAARDAAWAARAAWDAAWAARAAWDAAWAARDAAGAAAGAARDAAGASGAAAGAAWDAAWDAAGAAQKTEFLRMLDCIENNIKYEI